MKFSLLVDRKL